MNTYNLINQPRLWATILLLAFLQGCASGPNANPADPLEPFNRTVFRFNDGLDRAILKPVATAYRDVTPLPVRQGVTNFFGNLNDVWSFINNVLQLKPEEAADTFFRVTVNTFWGMGGLFDVASDMNIEKHREDFGLTLGHYGVGPGPYVVLPLVGSSTFRDSLALLVDKQGDLVTRVNDVATRNSLFGIRLVNARSNLLQAGEMLDRAALDKYSFARDVYLQRRSSLITRGNEKEERYDLPESAPAGGAPAAADVVSPLPSSVR